MEVLLHLLIQQTGRFAAPPCLISQEEDQCRDHHLLVSQTHCKAGEEWRLDQTCFTPVRSVMGWSIHWEVQSLQSCLKKCQTELWPGHQNQLPTTFMARTLMPRNCVPLAVPWSPPQLNLVNCLQLATSLLLTLLHQFSQPER